MIGLHQTQFPNCQLKSSALYDRSEQVNRIQRIAFVQLLWSSGKEELRAYEKSIVCRPRLNLVKDIGVREQHEEELSKQM